MVKMRGRRQMTDGSLTKDNRQQKNGLQDINGYISQRVCFKNRSENAWRHGISGKTTDNSKGGPDLD